MEFNNIIWSKKSYNQLINYLLSLEDKEYKDFNSKLVNTKYTIIGIRVPILRNIAKKIVKTNIKEYLNLINTKYYEEVMIMGLVISYSNEFIIDEYLIKYIDLVDNWALCDIVCSNLKIALKKHGKYWIYFINLIDVTHEFQTRFCIVMFMNYYLNDNYIDRVLNIVINLKTEYYYVNMAISWLLSYVIIDYRDKLENILNSKVLCKFVQNKTISKISDSYRVDKELKNSFKKYKI